VTDAQVEHARATTTWYLKRYHGTADDPGVARMFCDPEKVGAFAVSEAALAAGEGDALFGVLVATCMFQRRQDLQIMRVLRGIPAEDAAELSSAPRLLALADGAGCEHGRTLERLLGQCDLAKDPLTRHGVCAANPAVACSLKRHTVLLKRYGHFGKVPTSLALMIREHGVGGLPGLRRRVLAEASTAAEASAALEQALCRAWRVSDKIAAMYLSMLTNPDLSPGVAPWAEGVDHSHYVVIDSNVDLFLKAIAFPGPWTYRARRAFIQALARRVDVSALKPGLSEYNPRLVQQAMYLLMSETHRRHLPDDCGHVGAAACEVCHPGVRTVCPLRH
jgi:hypothetical protein